MNGQTLLQRENLFLLLGAANRDPEAFGAPTGSTWDAARVGISRSAAGSYPCVGAPLARLVGWITIAMLIERFRSMKLAGRCPPFRQRAALRGLESLSVRLVPAGDAITPRPGGQYMCPQR